MGKPSRLDSDFSETAAIAGGERDRIGAPRERRLTDLTGPTDMKDFLLMQTTLRINDRIYRQAKAEAARVGITLTEFIERALASEIRRSANLSQEKDIQERNELMEALLRRTAGFRVGRKPTRQEMNAR